MTLGDSHSLTRPGAPYVHPFALEADRFAGSRKSAEHRLDRLRLTKGQRIAYVFDFGDEWRVRLTLRKIMADGGGPYRQILESVGDAPPQYPDYDEEVDAA